MMRLVSMAAAAAGNCKQIGAPLQGTTIGPSGFDPGEERHQEKTNEEWCRDQISFHRSIHQGTIS